MDLETNGTLIDAHAARFLREEAGVGFVSVSIDSVDPSRHDAFRGVRGAYDRVVAAVRHLVTAGYRPQVIMSPHRGNVAEVDSVVALAVGLGAGSVKFNPITKVGRGRALHERGEGLDYNETRSLIRHVFGPLQARTPIPLHLGAPMALLNVRDLLSERWKGVCSVESTLGLLGTGQMAMCGIGREIPDLVYGQLGKDDLRDVWISSPALIALRRALVGPWPGVCGDCVHADFCRTGCLAINHATCGSLVAPNELCREANERGEFPSTRRRRGGAPSCGAV